MKHGWCSYTKGKIFKSAQLPCMWSSTYTRAQLPFRWDKHGSPHRVGIGPQMSSIQPCQYKVGQELKQDAVMASASLLITLLIHEFVQHSCKEKTTPLATWTPLPLPFSFIFQRNGFTLAGYIRDTSISLALSSSIATFHREADCSYILLNLMFTTFKKWSS